MSKTLLDGGTSTTTGGTAQVFVESGEKIANGVVLVDQADTDFFTRAKLYAVTRMPSENTDGIWSKQKTSLRYVVPKVLADGSVAYNLVRVEVELHPESTAAELADLREKGAQLTIDSEFDTMYSTGSLE